MYEAMEWAVCRERLAVSHWLTATIFFMCLVSACSGRICKNRPVIILSNNDGCAVSRSNEAKALGVKMGVPVFKIRDLVREHGIEVFSSNYVLYADMSNRVMSILSQFSPVREVYSIDEAFLDLTGFTDIQERARSMRERVYQETGIPVCVGIGPSKKRWPSWPTSWPSGTRGPMGTSISICFPSPNSTAFCVISRPKRSGASGAV
ncbi:hypothetical protein ACFS07_36335 [Undibacterium arcticum]